MNLSLEESIPYLGRSATIIFSSVQNIYSLVWERVYKDFVRQAFEEDCGNLRLWVKLYIAFPKCMSMFTHIQKSLLGGSRIICTIVLWVFQRCESMSARMGCCVQLRSRNSKAKWHWKRIQGRKVSRLVCWDQHKGKVVKENFLWLGARSHPDPETLVLWRATLEKVLWEDKVKDVWY